MRILLTGPTGLVGSAVLSRLLRRGHRVVAVSRRRAGRSACDRIRSLITARGLSSLLDSVEVFAGDEGRSLGDWMREHGPPDAVIHSAGSVKFSCDLATLRRENPEATDRLFDDLDAFAPDATFHFVSTAYVCGRRTGTVLEGDRGGSGSPYECSKLEAEGVVIARATARGRPWIILRPSVVGGDWSDGAAAGFNGIGQFLKALDIAAGTGGSGCHAPLLVRCDARTTKNIVPCDWVAAVVTAAAERHLSRKTFHLTHPAPPLHADLLPLLQKATGIEGLSITADRGGGGLHPLQALLDRMLSSFAPYLLASEPFFDRRELEGALPDLATPPPIDAGYLRRLVAFGRRSRWAARPLEDGLASPRGTPLPAA